MKGKDDPPDEWLRMMADRWRHSSNYDEARMSMACTELRIARMILRPPATQETDA